MKDIGFRPALEADFFAVMDIFSKAVDAMCEAGIFQWDDVYPAKSDMRRDMQEGHMYLLTDRGEIVSAITINEQQDEQYRNTLWKHEGRIAVLHRLCVHPALQNKGYGKETLLCAERIIKDENYNAIRLDAYSMNPYALKLYESLGYEMVGRVRFRKGIFFLYEKAVIPD